MIIPINVVCDQVYCEEVVLHATDKAVNTTSRSSMIRCSRLDCELICQLNMLHRTSLQ